MSVERATFDEPGRARPAEIVSGYLSSLAIFASLVSLAWHPLRLVLVSMVLALLAAAMAGRHHRRLAPAAVFIAAACFFLGMTIAVVTERPLW
ncbi:MAG: hypothetical protein IRZ20_08595 [Thermoleophilia bacterium]|nr:hypothetical protein [Thermoleophilia bacterium]